MTHPLTLNLLLPLFLLPLLLLPHAGKSKDTLELSELAAPLLDVVMSPGQILYVPAGFPHTTGEISSRVLEDEIQYLIQSKLLLNVDCKKLRRLRASEDELYEMTTCCRPT